MMSISSRFGGGTVGSLVTEREDFAGGLSSKPPGRNASSILPLEYENPSVYYTRVMNISSLTFCL